ncbi:MAG: hypothetical protein LUF02_10785, partial [Erysipelotrichaceae bacterium]|nr:hypothetical protein [Erysipelotrichaceae bacterium]
VKSLTYNFLKINLMTLVHGANTWAWENMKEVTISEKDVYIEIKRKLHMTKHVTAEATIEYR